MLLPLVASASAWGDGGDVVTPGPGAVAVRVSPAGVVARACAGAAGCSAEGGQRIEVPADIEPMLAKARARVVPLDGGKSVVRVDAPADDPRWSAIVAASGGEVALLWSGTIGAARGEHGEERTNVIVDEATARGARRLVVAERRDDVSLCGRPTLVGAKQLDPQTMQWRPMVVDNLAADRGKAVALSAAEATGEAPGGVRVLRATSASSAVERRFTTLTDGDVETVWSEAAKSGDGRGSFVRMSAPPEVPITGFDLWVRPARAEVAGGVAPKRVFLVTDDGLFAVTLADDAWKKPGARYEVKLPQPVRTSCLALVLDESFAPRDAKEARVSVAEIDARTEWSGQPPQALVGALAGGSERSRSAAAVLVRAGAPGVAATVAGYDALDDAGRELARGVVDAAGCAEQVPFWVDRLVRAAAAPAKKRAPADPDVTHAQGRLRRCDRKTVAPALERVLREAPDAAKLVAAEELSLLAPAEAVPVLLDAIAPASPPVRQRLREALAHAAKSDRAVAALVAELEAARFAARPEVARIDLLRALGPRIATAEGGVAAFASLSAGAPSFRTRFLLLGPAAELARGGAPSVLPFLTASLRSDADAHLRARAAAVSVGVGPLVPALVAAVDDPEPRVREAAAFALELAGTTAQARAAATALARRLASDPWTFVRVGAARTLGKLPADGAVDAALARALRDPSVEVRGNAIDALGAHRATAHAPLLRARAGDVEEPLEIRTKSMLALAQLCDKGSVDAWTKLALRTASPASVADRRLGAAAVIALGMVHPADLRQRLAPLLDKGAPVDARELAKDALAAAGSCR